MSLLIWIKVSASLKLVLNRHLSSINRTLVSLVKLGCAVHYWVHVNAFLCVLVWQRPGIVDHQAPGHIYIQVGLSRANLLQGAYKVSRRVHFLHDQSHGWGCVILLLFLLKYILWDSWLVLRLQRLVFKEVLSHYTVYFFKVLQHSHSRFFFCTWHVLVQMIVRVHLNRCPSCLVKGLSRHWRRSLKLVVLMKSCYQTLIMPCWRPSQHEMSLSQELRALCSGLNFLVIIDGLFVFSLCVHHFLETHFTISHTV